MFTSNQSSDLQNKESLENYLILKYPISLYSDEEGGYVAEIKDLPGCLTQGDTLEETINSISIITPTDFSSDF